MTSVDVIRSPGWRFANCPASLALYGMVIAGMKPLMSSCLMLASWRSAVIDRICPCKRVFAAIGSRPAARGDAAEKHQSDGQTDVSAHIVYKFTVNRQQLTVDCQLTSPEFSGSVLRSRLSTSF